MNHNQENISNYNLDELSRQYFVEKLPIAEIARIHSTAPSLMFYFLKKHFPDIEYRKTKISTTEKLSKEKLIELYCQLKMPKCKIAEQYGISEQALRRLFKKYNLVPENKLPKKNKSINKRSRRIWGDSELSKIRKIYNMSEKQVPFEEFISKINRKGLDRLFHLVTLYHESNLSQIKLSGLYGVSKAYISKIFKIHNIPTRNLSEAAKLKDGAYKINDVFFDTWSKNMAYILGLILTDGSLYENTVSIALKDSDILEKVKNALSSEHPIRKYQGRDIYIFSFGNLRISNRLKELGITAHKSLTVKFPNVPDAYLSHFIRGIFDGDGSIYYEKQRRGLSFRVDFTSGSCDFLYALENKCHKFAYVNHHPIHEKKVGQAFQLKYSHEDCIKLFLYMYKDCGDLFLKRKYDKFIDLMNTKENIHSLIENRTLSLENKVNKVMQYFNYATPLNSKTDLPNMGIIKDSENTE